MFEQTKLRLEGFLHNSEKIKFEWLSNFCEISTSKFLWDFINITFHL